MYTSLNKENWKFDELAIPTSTLVEKRSPMCWWKFFEAAFQRVVREILVDLQEQSNNQRDERLEQEATGGGFVFFGGTFYC